MFEQLKQILTIDYQNELSRFDHLKRSIEKIESKMMNDNSEDEYQNKLAELNKKYNLVKRNSQEYKKELADIQNNYAEQLKKFEEIYNHCIDLKNEAANINIYVIQKKKEQLMNATSLEDLKMTEEEAAQIVEEKQGIEPIVYNENEIDEYLESYNYQSEPQINNENNIIAEDNIEELTEENEFGIEENNSFDIKLEENLKNIDQFNNNQMNNMDEIDNLNLDEATDNDKKRKNNKLIIGLVIILLLVIVVAVILNYLPLFEI